jgi:hypothetical protein
MANDGTTNGRSGANRYAIPLVTACLAVAGTALGAFIGGRTANEGAKDIQEAQASRDDVRQRAEVRGAARVLMYEFRRVRASMLTSGQARKWFRFDYHVNISRADRKVLAAYISGDQWDAVVSALAFADSIQAGQRNGFQWSNRTSEALASGSRAALLRGNALAPSLG